MRRSAAFAWVLLFGLACNRPKTLDPRAPHLELVYRVPPAAADATVAVLKARLDRSGVASRVEKQGDLVVVKIDPNADFAAVKRMMAKQGRLEFVMVDESAEANAAIRAVQLPEGVSLEPAHWSDQRGQQHEQMMLSAKSKKALEPLAAKFPARWRFALEDMSRDDQPHWVGMLLQPSAELANDRLQDAEVVFDQQLGRPEVNVTFTPEGARLFADSTEKNAGRKLAIVVDGQVQSAPIIMDRISGGRARITMGGVTDPMQQQDEAKTLVAVLRTGALPAPLELIRMENK